MGTTLSLEEDRGSSSGCRQSFVQQQQYHPLHGALLLDQEEEDRIRHEMMMCEKDEGYNVEDESSSCIVPEGAAISASSSPDSSCNGREEEEEEEAAATAAADVSASSESIASVVERMFLEQQKQEEATIASKTDGFMSCSSISSSTTSTRTKPRRRRRIIHVYQTYSTSLVPRSRMPQEMIDELEAQEEEEAIMASTNISTIQTPRSHIPFRKCRHLDCKCHDDNDHDASFAMSNASSSVTSVSRGISKKQPLHPSQHITTSTTDAAAAAAAATTPNMNILHSFSSITTEDTSRRTEPTRHCSLPTLPIPQHCKEEEEEEDLLVGLWVEPASTTTPVSSNRKLPNHKIRARSEDYVDHGAVLAPVNTTKQRSRSSASPTPRQPPKVNSLFHIRSEAKATSVKTKNYAPTRSSAPSKTRCRSEDIIDGDRTVVFTNLIHTDTTTSVSQTPPNSNNSMVDMRESPTSVAAFPDDFKNRASKQQRQAKTTAMHHHPLEATLQAYRTSIQQQRKQRHVPKLQRAMQLASTYYHMACIHHQLGRYQTSLHVLDHSVEVLIQAAAMAAGQAGAFAQHGNGDIFDDTPDPSHLPLLSETIPFLSSQALLLVASIFTAQAKIYLAQGLCDAAKNRVEQVMICLGHERLRRNIGPPLPYLNGGCSSTATDFSLTMARAQVVLGSCYEKQRRPDLAMRCFQDTLHIQRFLLGDCHVQVADTVKCMGDLHLSQCMLGPAAGCYQEALRVYRYLAAAQQQQLQYLLPTGHNSLSLAADTAALLTSLGWISLLQHDLIAAWSMSLEALQLVTQSNGKAHRNVASIRYQLGWIQWWSAPAAPRAPRIALSEWKHVLKHQERALKRRCSREEVYQSMNDPHNHSHHHHCRKHVDLAKTLHAIGYAYHASGNMDKSRHAMQAADDIYRVNLPRNTTTHGDRSN